MNALISDATQVKGAIDIDKNIKELFEAQVCDVVQRYAFYDFTNAIVDKWRMLIIGGILHDKLRCGDMYEKLSTVTPRMLSKEV